MHSYLFLRLFLLISLCVTPFFMWAQCASTSLTPTYDGGLVGNGIMFDVTAANDLLITCFDLSIYQTGAQVAVKVYYKSGTCVGYDTDSTAWNLLGTVPVVAAGSGVATRVALPAAQALVSGATGAFYFDCSASASYLAYTPGTAVGALAASDDNLTIKQNYAVADNFSGSFAPRMFNGAVYYSLGSPLPVTLVSFTGKAQAAGNLLKWQTASETNSAYFEVERSADNQVFGPLGRVGAAGTSAQQRPYAYLDHAPSGQWYYRLRQVDLDGRSQYSPVVVVASQRGALAYYPNPVVAKLYLAPAGETAYPLTVRLYTVSGQAVYQHVYPAAAPEALAVDVAALPAGLYLLHTTTATGQVSHYPVQKARE